LLHLSENCDREQGEPVANTCRKTFSNSIFPSKQGQPQPCVGWHRGSWVVGLRANHFPYCEGGTLTLCSVFASLHTGFEEQQIEGNWVAEPRGGD